MIKKFSRLKQHHQFIFGLIVLSATIALWRGIWGFLDVFLFPSELWLSYLLSIVMGIVILAATHYSIDKLA